MKKHETNRFTVTTSISFPNGIQGDNILHWLNRQWTGKPTIPLTKKIPKDMLEAAYAIHRCRTVTLTIEVDKDGNWKLIEAKI
jgi:hypothetical protein